MNGPAQATLLEPVSADDPCGPDLRWDPEVSTLETTLAQLVRPSEQGAIVAQAAESEGDPKAKDLIERTAAISARTKSVAVLSVHARARWLEEGLAGFAQAMETLAQALERWPDAGAGIHPRADEDGDLGERTAALARALGAIPSYADHLGWGKTRAPAERARAARTLAGVLEPWTARAGPASAGDAPSAREAWGALCALEGFAPEAPPPDAQERTPDEDAALRAGGGDAWALLGRSIEAMERSNAHSPGLLLLRLAHSWRGLEIAEIVEATTASGVGFEALMKAAKQQVEKGARG